jgi:hypothetical protein
MFGMKRREFITLLGGHMAARGTRAAGSNADGRISQQRIA